MQTITLTDELREAHREALHVAAGKITNAREDRDDAIWQAVRDGMSVAEIARTVGLTRARVYQIASSNGTGPIR